MIKVGAMVRPVRKSTGSRIGHARQTCAQQNGERSQEQPEHYRAGESHAAPLVDPAGGREPKDESADGAAAGYRGEQDAHLLGAAERAVGGRRHRGVQNGPEPTLSSSITIRTAGHTRLPPGPYEGARSAGP